MKNEYANMNEYAEIIAKEVGGEVVHVDKLNGIKMCGIRKGNVSPIFYVNTAYEKDIDVKEVINMCKMFFAENYELCHNILDALETFDVAKPYITARLVNRELNTEISENAPHRDVMGDLTILYYIDVKNNDMFYSALITNKVLDFWSVTEPDLFLLAKENVIKHAEIKSLGDFLGPLADPFFTILTNDTCHYGAASILAFEEIKDKLGADDVYLIPSSVHEWLILPNPDNSFSKDALAFLIQDVNQSVVIDTEVLSDHPYRVTDIDF